MVHLCSGIADDFYALGQKLVSVLMMEVVSRCFSRGFLQPFQRKKGRKSMACSVVAVVVGLLTRPKSAGNCEFQRVHVSAKVAEQKLKPRRNP